MERGNKHGARMDDTMASEVSGMTRAERDTRPGDFRSAEPSGEDQPDVDLSPHSTLTGGTPEGLTSEDVELRSEFASYLPQSVWPAVREVLIDTAMQNEAPDRIVDLVKRLPAGREFTNVGEAYETVAGGHEEQRF